MNTYLNIQKNILEKFDFSDINVRCYICNKKGHIA